MISNSFSKIIIPLFALTLLVACDDDNANFCPNNTPDAYLKFDNFSQSDLVSQRRFVTCHNCYEDDEHSVALNVEKISKAIVAGVDGIELDILFTADDILVSHDEDGTGAELSAILASDVFLNRSPDLFLEIKNSQISVKHIERLLTLLTDTLLIEDTETRERSTVVLRTALGYKEIELLRLVLSKPKYNSIVNDVLVSQILYPKSPEATNDDVTQAYNCGANMVEFDIRTQPAILIEYSDVAMRYGMITSLFTLDEQNIETTFPELIGHFNTYTVSNNRNRLESGQESLFIKVKHLLN